MAWQNRGGAGAERCTKRMPTGLIENREHRSRSLLSQQAILAVHLY